MKSIVALLLLLSFAVLADDEIYAKRRAALVSELQQYSMLSLDPYEVRFSDEVLEALNTVPRHRMVPAREVPFAYENRPLPIGHGQTISQPYIVALMTELVRPDADDVVLEVGTGSGYQAAVLAGLVRHVYSIEIIEPLAEQARDRLAELGYDTVTVRLGDGYFGWQEHAPFDAIVVTAAASHVPPPLIEQLKPGGYMVIPVGGRWMVQQLLLIEKTADGEIITRQQGAVRFVPLTGEH
jgi:protein-L-isoaspartate(D-aspartate) O-methyltransferase